MKHCIVYIAVFVLILFFYVDLGSCERDFYKILGLSRDASHQDIKKAYRRLALKHHPDKNKGDPKAEDKFIEISYAYEVLSDDDKKAKYDQFGEAGIDPSKAHQGGPQGGAPGGGFQFNFGNGGGRSGNGGGFDAFKVFEQFFGKGFDFGSSGGGGDQGMGGMPGMGGMGGMPGMGNMRGMGQQQQQQRQQKPTVKDMYVNNKDIIQLNSNNMKQKLKEDDTWMILFYSSNFDKPSQSEFENSANQLKSFIKIGVVNIDKDQNNNLMKEYLVEKSPSIVLLPSKNHKNKEKFQGKFNSKEIIHFSLSKIPNIVTGVRHSTFDRFLSQSKVSVSVSVLLFTSTVKIPPLYNAIAESFKDKASFGLVSKSDTQLVEKYNVKEFPSIVVIPNQHSSSSPRIFNEKVKDSTSTTELNYEKFKSFLQDIIKSSNKNEKLDFKLTKKTKDTLCNPEKDSYCAIFFIESSSSKMTKYEKVISDLQSKFQKFKFSIVDRQKQQEFSNWFGNHNFIVFNPKKMKYIFNEKEESNLEIATISSLLENIMSGLMWNRIEDDTKNPLLLLN